MEPVSVRTLPLRNPHLILEACLLISLSVPTIGCLIPQPKANVWATLARAMGQDHTCLSATSADNPLTTCLVGIPFQPEEFPSKLLEMQTPVNCEGISEGQTVSWNSPPKSFVGVKINLPVKNPLILWQKYVPPFQFEVQNPKNKNSSGRLMPPIVFSSRFPP
ncbi:hypothetical protein DUI87_21615 [Hirundo rustica rustica]|uniref:Uncharacterized protein n=1 Tax=Hirundo rustica rustica TaxID=333673 RepID=A0A3M0K407_HIRRU|nr:hypothetical protein DUI87_21615 [Hirundo rustica rustica]